MVIGSPNGKVNRIRRAGENPRETGASAIPARLNRLQRSDSIHRDT
jgi:hypothetical protein